MSNDYAILTNPACFCSLRDTRNRHWLPFEVENIDSPWEADIPYEGMYPSDPFSGGYGGCFPNFLLYEGKRYFP